MQHDCTSRFGTWMLMVQGKGCLSLFPTKGIRSKFAKLMGQFSLE